jgi:hypothetical protein
MSKMRPNTNHNIFLKTNKTNEELKECCCFTKNASICIFWTFGCMEGFVVGFSYGCYETSSEYDFTEIKKILENGFYTGFFDGEWIEHL